MKPVSRNATSSLHAHSEGCFGEARTPHVALFGPSVVTQIQRNDPGAGGTKGVARPKPGVLKPDEACLPECNQQHSRPLRKAASERLDPPHVALFGPSVVTQVQRPDPRDSGARGVASPKPGPGRGARPAQGDVTPGRMAAKVLKPDQGCLPECNQQPSYPLRRLLPGGWTPHAWPFSGLVW